MPLSKGRDRLIINNVKTLSEPKKIADNWCYLYHYLCRTEIREKMHKRLAKYKDKEFVVIKTLSFEEQADLKVMFSVINNFDAQNLKFEIVLNIHQDVLSTLKSGRPSHLLLRQIMELMSTFNAFLNHWNTVLKREFGESSQNYLDFKKCTNDQFDNHFEYRFLCGLRNYIHHCGMPNITISESLDDNENLVYEFTVNKAELLAGMDWHKRVKADFQLMEDSFDIFPFFKVLIKSVTRIHNMAINNIDVIKLLLCAQKMITYKKYIDGDDTQLVLLGYGGFSSTGQPTNLNYELFKFNLADYLIEQIKQR